MAFFYVVLYSLLLEFIVSTAVFLQYTESSQTITSYIYRPQLRLNRFRVSIIKLKRPSTVSCKSLFFHNFFHLENFLLLILQSSLTRRANLFACWKWKLLLPLAWIILSICFFFQLFVSMVKGYSRVSTHSGIVTWIGRSSDISKRINVPIFMGLWAIKP